MQSAEITLPGTPSSVPAARHFVAATLAGWGLSALDWAATLVVSELAANAALHARTDFTVAVAADGDGGARIEVRDASPLVPRQRGHSTEATTGRGLRLVDDVCAQWGVLPGEGAAGKTVWAVLAPAGEAEADLDGDVDLDLLLAGFPDETESGGRADRLGGEARAA